MLADLNFIRLPIGVEGGLVLSEALKTNTAVTSLQLGDGARLESGGVEAIMQE